MISFFYGNPVSVREAAQKKVAAFLKLPPARLVQTLDLREAGQADRLGEELEAQSFFAEKKVLIIKGACSSLSADILDLFKRYWQHPSSDIELIFQEEDSPEKTNKKLFEWLSKKAEVVQFFGEVKGAKLQKWIEEKLKMAGLTISAKALSRLLGWGPDKLEQEINKLAAYKNYRGSLVKEVSRRVEEADVEELIRPELGLNSFELADAIANKDQRKGIKLLHTHLAGGEDPYAILGLLVYQFRNLLKIKALIKKPVPYADLPGITKLHPFVVKKSYEQVKKFELEDLKKIYGQLFALEVGAKDGWLDLPSSLYCWILGL